jgi:hypothetical protein
MTRRSATYLPPDRTPQGKHFDEEAERFNAEDDEDEVGQKRRAANQGHLSSMKSGRDIKDLGVGEDWEHSEDSEEEDERRKSSSLHPSSLLPPPSIHPHS